MHVLAVTLKSGASDRCKGCTSDLVRQLKLQMHTYQSHSMRVAAGIFFSSFFEFQIYILPLH